MSLQSIIMAVMFIAIVVLSAQLFLQMESTSNLKKMERQLKAELESVKTEREEIIRKIKLTRDTLDAVYHVMTGAQIRARKAEINAEKLQKRYEEIIYSSIPNDSLRNRAWAELYPALDSIR